MYIIIQLCRHEVARIISLPNVGQVISKVIGKIFVDRMSECTPVEIMYKTPFYDFFKLMFYFQNVRASLRSLTKNLRICVMFNQIQ